MAPQKLRHILEKVLFLQFLDWKCIILYFFVFTLIVQKHIDPFLHLKWAYWQNFNFCPKFRGSLLLTEPEDSKEIFTQESPSLILSFDMGISAIFELSQK